MPHTDDAGCRSGNRQGCLRGTRRDVLLQLEHWLKDEQDHRVFWLNGLAGTGKSTIAQTFAEISFADGKLGASFFCSRDFEDRSKLRVIFPTIAFQLAYRYPLFRERLLQVLRATPGIGRESLCSQMEKIVVEPLKATPIRTLIIIDALDECKDEEPASAILSVLSRYVDKIPRVKFFITGRPEPRIRSGFRLKSLRPITEVLRLHDVERSSVDGDIKLFFETQFSDVAKTRSDCNLAEDWPSPQNIDILCRKAAGFFIYASTVVKFVSSPRCPPDERLNIIVSFPQDTSREGRLGIDLLYAQVLGQAFHNVDSHDHEVYSHFKSVLGAVMFVFYPLPINTLSDLLMNCGSPSKISSSLRTLHSVLLVPASTEDPVQIFHKSFPDFLTDPGRCTDHRFFIDPSVHHKEVLLSCLNVMKERLKRNICHLDDHVDLSKIKDLPTLRTTHIGSTLEYACQFWTNHLAKVSSISHGMEEVHKAIDDFFTTSFLFWIEVLVLTGNLDIGVHALNDIEKWYTLVSYFEFLQRPILMSAQTGAPCKWTSDSRLFILDNFDTIQHSPFRMYSSALVLCPPSSWLYSYCTVGVKAVVGSAGWGICTHRTVSHKCCPITLACQNNTVATGYMDSNNIIILDALTGSQLDTLSGHTGVVQSLAFSSDGTLLVSGSHDKTVKLWDIQTGGVAKTLYGHTGQVYSVSVSADNTMVASGSQDMTIRLWDIKTGDCLVIKGHKRPVNAVTFSPTNPQLFLSSSYDGTVRQWSIDGYQIGSSIPGNFVAFSPDGTQFVLYKKKTVTIQNINSRGTVVELKLADYLEYCHFSPDGRHIATISPSVIHLWDITGTNPCLIQTLRHPSRITFLVFLSSYCLISACSDGSIRFWQIGASLGDPVVSNSEPTSLTPAPIQSVSLQAKDNLAFSIDSGGIVKIWDILTGCCKEIHKTQANAIKHGDIQFVDNKFIIVWSEESNQIIHIWDTDTEKGGLRQVFCGSRIMGLRITEDGSRVLVVHWRSINAWSILTGEHVGSKKLKWEKCCFDPLRMNGSRVLVRSGESLVQGWDFGIPGSIPVQFSKVHSERPHLNFVDVRQWSRGSPVRIEDGVTGREVFQLCGRYANPSATQWDGQYLIAGYDSGEVLILDFNHVVV